MKPSVGRIVHYTGFGDEQGGECYAAIVTRVNGDLAANNVDLTTFPPSETHPPYIHRAPMFDRDVTGGGNEPGHGQWHWPERVEE